MLIFSLIIFSCSLLLASLYRSVCFPLKLVNLLPRWIPSDCCYKASISSSSSFWPELFLLAEEFFSDIYGLYCKIIAISFLRCNFWSSMYNLEKSLIYWALKEYVRFCPPVLDFLIDLLYISCESISLWLSPTKGLQSTQQTSNNGNNNEMCLKFDLF